MYLDLIRLKIDENPYGKTGGNIDAANNEALLVYLRI
jgi:hypothetical protein